MHLAVEFYRTFIVSNQFDTSFSCFIIILFNSRDRNNIVNADNYVLRVHEKLHMRFSRS